MAGTVDSPSPLYISSHSADVILSDVRPIKLKIEALRSINVLVDEILYNILSTASSLSTDKLRASLLSLLPTTLGKEALLEAEVELRAYWDRTTQVDNALEDDTSTFHLQWAFELLRLKCEAYSTLNETDEDHEAEGRINTKMATTTGTEPSAALMAPAALYLTAILEAVCEHILSSIGRVVARDSSRTSATVQDLFVALCEDHSIYDLFKNMKVYEQIELLSKAPRVRRSKSFTRNEKSSRTSSPHHDLSTNKETSTRTRISSEGPGIAANGGSASTSMAGPRSSIEKARAMKMFKVNGGRPSIDRDPEIPNGHRKSDSVVSESSRHTPGNEGGSIYEDEVLQQEFDDLMRSSATMKVSLTPDRLKSMEVYKQEKDQRGSRKRPGPLLSFNKSDADSSALPPRATGRRPSLLRVDSIKEDDEESSVKSSPSPVTRARQNSASSPSTPVTGLGRIRSVSTSSSKAASRAFAKIAHPVSMQNRQYATKGHDSFPNRTRKVQRNRESLDLDDVMGVSDDDEAPPKLPAKPTTPVRKGPPHISASTRELIDFLAEGPPDTGGDTNGDHRPLNGSPDGAKLKGTGRLQRMMSKLSLSNPERLRGTDDSAKSKMSPQPGYPSAIPSKPSLKNLSSLANRPIPPRPPRPISPPASPHDSSDEQNLDITRPRGASASQIKAQLPVEARPSESTLSGSSPREHSGSISSNNPHSSLIPAAQHSGGAVTYVPPVIGPPRTISAQVKTDNLLPPTTSTATSTAERHKPQGRSHVVLPSSPTRKPPPTYVEPNPTPHLSAGDAQDIQRLLSKATTADECRLIFNAFLAKSGISVEPTNYDVPYPSPSPSVIARQQAKPEDEDLEAMLVALFLGGEPATDTSTRKRRAKKRAKPNVEAELSSSSGNGTANGEAGVENRDIHSVSGTLESSSKVSSHAKRLQTHTLAESHSISETLESFPKVPSHPKPVQAYTPIES